MSTSLLASNPPSAPWRSQTEPAAELRRVLGLDLGTMSDPSALALLEWAVPTPSPEPVPVFRQRPVYRVRTLKRWPLGTSYPAICDGMVKFYQTPELKGATLVIDETGVGLPVAQMVFLEMNKAQVDGKICGVTITAGHEVNHVAGGRWHVPKRTLVSVLQTLLQTGRLQVSPELAEAETLVKELLTFKVKVNVATGHESFESWRERDHDDLVLAVALACWAAETLDLGRPRE